jgi:hypothetical protein
VLGFIVAVLLSVFALVPSLGALHAYRIPSSGVEPTLHCAARSRL